ncbi:tripartite tricarboxylate transporter substrate binding protein [Tropicimonas isoalkanivorans]|uniref:Tripartite-type tricarboxylate transporter, receptor component TctC n=1 Tax=Tropicimonas isoalkanivorans TaxID=441112 RepID=A0A1I1Q671_9RHOB|nr:tripartite tricarboxylate transporter substrate binding protein [Tropicimonas isoalkanivorans]SFD17646.1 Tripartite-type tricarboxylate transporter, receptor component TctC [Tropicimonas isoalkanivorans]
MNRKLMGAVVAAILAAAPALAEFPEKDLQGIVMWGAGGSTDTVMRSVTPHAEEVLGSDVIIQNMTGGVGAIATKYVFAQKPDGYTLLLGAENPQLYKVMGLGELDYSDFIPINVLARGVPVIVANNDAPFDTFTEMVDYVSAHPNEVKFGTTGPGGLPSTVTAMLSSKLELPVTEVPYDGDGPAITALQSGAIHVVPVVMGVAIEHVKAGRVKPIALIDVEPNPLMPDLPPITEEYPDFATYLPWGPFFGVFVKKGTPDEAVEKLKEAFAAGAENQEFKDLMAARGYSIMNISGDEAVQFLEKYQSVTSWLVHDAGIAKTSPEEFDIPRP